MKTLKNVLILLLIIVSCKKEKFEKNIKDSKYSFFVAGHSYGKAGVNNAGLHPPFQEKFDFINSNEFMDFGVLTGDIVWAATKKSWNDVDSVLTQINHPVYFAAGNHDVADRTLFESRYGITYKSFIQNSDLFIILDPNIDNWNISGKQLEFLKTTISNNYKQVDNIFVFFHQLLWWSPDNFYKKIRLNSRYQRDDVINFWTEIEPLFNSLPNNTYMFAGDVGAFNNGHEFMYHKYDNITLIASGMGGGVRDNFVIVDISEDKTVSFRLIALNGDDINSLGKLEDYKIP